MSRKTVRVDAEVTCIFPEFSQPNCNESMALRVNAIRSNLSQGQFPATQEVAPLRWVAGRFMAGRFIPSLSKSVFTFAS